MSGPRGFVVTIVGADGSGKSTVAQQLVESLGRARPARYVYMGMNAQSNALALPTTRLILRLKRRMYERSTGTQHERSASSSMRDLPDLGHMPGFSGAGIEALRLVNRIAEEAVRLLVVRRSLAQGQLVVCDRHFVYDFALKRLLAEPEGGGWADRLHSRLLARWYPRPDLAIFLDAPAEVLFARKADAPIQYLHVRQGRYRRASEVLPEFRAVDATQPLAAVVGDTIAMIEAYAAGVGATKGPRR